MSKKLPDNVKNERLKEASRALDCALAYARASDDWVTFFLVENAKKLLDAAGV